MASLFNARGTVGLNDRLTPGLRKVEAKVRKTMSSIDHMRAEAELRADISDLERKYREAQAMASKWEHTRATATFDADVDKADRALGRLRNGMRGNRNEVSRLRQQLSNLGRGGTDRNIIQRLGLHLLGRHLQRLRKLAQDTETPFGKLWAKMNDARVTLGPLSLSLRNLVIVGTALAPIIMSVVGTLAGLTAVVGGGLVGGIGLLGAGLAAFGPLAIGAALAAKPLVKDLGDVFKAQKAYDKAVKESGKDSARAKTAHDKLNEVLKHTSPELRHSARDLQGIGKAWRQATKSIRPQFFRTIAQGIKTAHALMPMFARSSAQAFNSAAQGVQKWMRGLRSAEGRNILGTLFNKANQAIPSLMDGLGNLGTVFGRVFKSFSRWFPRVADGFKNWTQHMADSVGKSKTLNQFVDNFMKDLGSLGELAGASGKLLLAFFNAGSEGGRSMVDDIVKQLNKWTDWLSKPGNQKKMTKWLDQQWDRFKKVMGFIGDLIGVFNDISKAATPAADAILWLVGALTKLLDILGKFPGAGLALQALIGSLVVLQAGRLAAMLGSLLGIGKAVSLIKRLGNPFSRWRAPRTEFGRGAADLRELQEEAGKTRRMSVTQRIRSVYDRRGAREAARTRARESRPVRQTIRSFFDRRGARAAERSRAQSARPINQRIRQTIDNRAERRARTEASKPVRRRVRAEVPRGERQRVERSISPRESEGVKSGQKWGAGATKGVKAGVRSGTRAQFTKGGAAAQAVMFFGDPDSTGKEFSERFSKQFQRGFARTSNRRLVQGAFTKLAGSLVDVPNEMEFAKKNVLSRFGERGVSGLGNTTKDLQKFRRAANQAFGPGVVRNAAQLRAGIRSTGQAVLGLAKTTGGKRFLIRIATSGDQKVRQTFNNLARTKIGRKILQVLSRGGPQAVRLMGTLTRTRIGRKLLQIVERGGKPAQAVLRLLGNAKLRQKVMRILEKGGRAAQGLLRGIQNSRLRSKVMRILERGGPGVRKALARIAGIKLPSKTQHTKGVGQQGVLNMLRHLIGIRIPTKAARVQGKDNASPVIQRILGLIASVHDKTATITTIHRTIMQTVHSATGGRGLSRWQHGGHTGDRSEGDPVRPRDMERAMAARRLDASGGRVFSPRLLAGGLDVVGEEPGSEFVIPTNPAFRNRALNLLHEAAASLGTGFRRGRHCNAACKRRKRKKAAARRNRRNRRADRRWIRQNLQAHPTGAVDAADRAIEEGEHQYDIQDRRYHIDAEDHPPLNEDGTVNKTNVNWHRVEIDKLIQKIHEVIGLYEKLRTEIDKALNGADGLFAGIRALNEWEPRSAWGRERRKDIMQDYRETAKDLGERDKEARFAIDDKKLDIHEKEQEKRAVLATKSSATEEPPGTQLGNFNAARADLMAQFAGNALNVSSMAAVVGAMGVMGGSAAPGMMGTSSAAPMLAAIGAGDVSSGALISSASGGVASTAPQGAIGAGAVGGAAGVAPPGSPTINQVNNFSLPPPDPHTFSQDVAWELQHAV